MVLVGRKHLVSQFTKRSPHAASVIADVTAWGSMHSKESVSKMTAPVVSAWRERHAQGYLQALAEADRAGQVTWGLQNVWDSVVAGRVERVWVERYYWRPARVTDDGKRLLSAERAEAPGVVADVVDLLIERATLAGAHVESVEHLGEDDEHRIAAQLKPPTQVAEPVLEAGAATQAGATAPPTHQAVA